jgi:hypothetical protein
MKSFFTAKLPWPPEEALAMKSSFAAKVLSRLQPTSRAKISDLEVARRDRDLKSIFSDEKFKSMRTESEILEFLSARFPSDRRRKLLYFDIIIGAYDKFHTVKG